MPQGPQASDWGWGETGKTGNLPSTDIRLGWSRPIGASSAPGTWRQRVPWNTEGHGAGEGRAGRQLWGRHEAHPTSPGLLPLLPQFRAGDCRAR